MNIIDKIKALWTLRSIVNEDLKEGKTMDGAKPGWKTSTFWIKVFTVDAPVLYAAVKGFLPVKTAATIEVSAMGIFAIYRTIIDLTKQIQVIRAPQAPTDAPVEVKPAA